MTVFAAKALLSHWRRHPFQLAVLIVGLAMATALWSGVQAINGEARASYQRAERATDMINLPRLTGTAGKKIEIAEYAALRRQGWPVSPVLIEGINSDGTSISLIGIDPFTHPMARQISSAFQGPAPIGWNRAFVHPSTLKSALALDLPIELDAADTVLPGQIIADIGVASDLLNRGDGIDFLVLVGAIPDETPSGMDLSEPAAALDIAGLTDTFHLNLTAFGFLAFAVGLFIVQGGIGLAIEQRRPVIRTLRTLGVPLGTVVVLLAIELLMLAFFGAALGLLLGYLLAGALLPDVSATLRGLYGAPDIGSLSLRGEWMASGLLLALIGTAAAGSAGLWQILRMPLLAPARPRAWSRTSAKRFALQAAIGVLIGAAGTLAFALLPGLPGGFSLVAGVLIAAALVLPICLLGAIRFLASRSNRPLRRWFWADTEQQLPSLLLALMALMLALAANVGVSTMVSSFRLTFVQWLDQRLVSDIYVSARTADEGLVLRQFLEERADAVLPIWYSEAQLFGLPAEIYGIIDDPSYRTSFPFVAEAPDPFRQLYAGEGVFLNEQTARRQGLWIGDIVTLGPGWQRPIVGIHSDYGNPGVQIVTDLSSLLAQAIPIVSRRFGVRVAPHLKSNLRAELINEFGLPPDAVSDQSNVKAFSLSIFDRTFRVTSALNILTLGIAGVALLTSLLTLATLRLPQLAPVWATGITQTRLSVLELLRALALALLALVLAIPVGLALAWILLSVVNVAAFGWRLPMQVFPVDWLRLGAVSALTAFLAALWPALRLSRMSPSLLAKVFASER